VIQSAQDPRELQFAVKLMFYCVSGENKKQPQGSAEISRRPPWVFHSDAEFV